MSYVSPTATPTKPPRAPGSNGAAAATSLFDGGQPQYHVYGVLGSGDGAAVLLGEADTGSTTSATRQDPSAVVALKLVSKSTAWTRRRVKRTETEYRILTSLPPHPHVVRLMGSFQTGVAACFVLELCPRGTLRDLMRLMPGSRVDGEELLRGITAEILTALAFLHVNRIVYRDLKPENVLIRDDGSLCITDFDLAAFLDTDGNAIRTSDVVWSGGGQGGGGQLNFAAASNASRVSPQAQSESDSVTAPSGSLHESVQGHRRTHERRSSDHSSHSSAAYVRPSSLRQASSASDAAVRMNAVGPTSSAGRTRRGSFVGTPYYMAPEVVTGDVPQTAAVDMWSLGMLMFELLYSATAFQSASEEDTLHRIVHHEKIPSPAEPVLSRDLRDLLSKLLRKDPTKRLTAREMMQHAWFQSVDWRCFTDRTPALAAYVSGKGDDAARADFHAKNDRAPLQATHDDAVHEGLLLQRVSSIGHTSVTLESYCATSMADVVSTDDVDLAESPKPAFAKVTTTTQGQRPLSRTALSAHEAFAFFESWGSAAATNPSPPVRLRGAELLAALSGDPISCM